MKITKKNSLLLVCALLCNQLAIADDDDMEPKPKQSNSSEIFLSSTAQSQAGIQTTVLKTGNHQTEFTATGKAVNLQALLNLRNRYLLSISENQSAKAKLNHSTQNLQRLQNLYESGVTAKRNLQAQQTQQQTEQAMLDASQIQSQTIKDEAMLNWGKVLTDWAFSTSGKAIQPFLSGQQTLILVSLPVGKELPATAKEVYCDTTGNRSKAIIAKFISSAPQPDAVLQGEHYFFQASGEKIKPGMKIMAWLPEQLAQTGVNIPQSAVIWFMNQAFVFVKNNADKFSRVALIDYSPSASGYFVASGLAAGQTIVTEGAQMLLSEEIRGQIPDD